MTKIFSYSSTIPVARHYCTYFINKNHNDALRQKRGPVSGGKRRGVSLLPHRNKGIRGAGGLRSGGHARDKRERIGVGGMADGKSGAVLVTGAAGFIGFHIARALLATGRAVLGVDCFTPYYDVALKRARLAALEGLPGFSFRELDIADRAGTEAAFAEARPDVVIHLAAQAGVGYSMKNPDAYLHSNMNGFLSILECCRTREIAHLLYASSSSVYGGNVRMPFSEGDAVDHPVSLYAATKKANELMAHTYAELFGTPMTGLRFFTVYGSWGRPDMAYWKFAEAIEEGRTIRLNNNGEMARDFTHIEDIVQGIMALIPKPPAPNPDFDRRTPDPATSWAPHRVLNIGNTEPRGLREFLAIIEAALGKQAVVELAPMPDGEVAETWADTSRLSALTGYRPSVRLEDGIHEFCAWWRSYRGAN